MRALLGVAGMETCPDSHRLISGYRCRFQLVADSIHHANPFMVRQGLGTGLNTPLHMGVELSDHLRVLSMLALLPH